MQLAGDCPGPAFAAPTLIGAGRGRDADAPWGDESRVAGVEEREEHYGFMHNVEMCLGVVQLDLRVGYDITKRLGMTMGEVEARSGGRS